MSVALAQQATAAPDGNGSQARLPGAEAPPAIPGYDPSPDPRDFRGVWHDKPLPGSVPFQFAPNIELSAEGSAETKRRMDLLLRMHGTTVATAHVMCRPAGIADALIPIDPIYILQNDHELVFVVTDEMRSVRHVYLNQPHPQHVTPSYEGDSIGHWEGNTLVIDTVGYNGRGELAFAGRGRHPLDGATYSDQMHFVQRITKSADGKELTIESTLDDPKALAHPASVTKRWAWLNGEQPLEYDCEENPREDNFAGMVYPDEYLRPICIQYEGKDAEHTSKVVCNAPKK